MTDSNACRTHLIEDLPADHDGLALPGEIGPHVRVARAIAELVTSPDERGGVMIGVEGGWGAGKTTVVALLQQKLCESTSPCVFLFDAWAHEGDPLRRTFLESLIRHFQRRRWVDQSRWDDVLSALANRRRVTKTRTIPKTTRLGTIFAISALLVPIGAVLLSAGLRPSTTANAGGHSPWLILPGIVGAAAPLLVILGNLVVIGCKRLARGRAAPGATSIGTKQISEWAFLKGEALQEMTQDTTETPEPTSIEFEGLFTALMNDALPERSDRRAVIVLDNLDRVDPQDARQMWATLQTFLQHRRVATEPWFSRIWIIVPYDGDGLRQLWAGRNVQEASPAGEEGRQGSVSDEAMGVAPTVSGSFIDKSFVIRFELPPPVLSSWKNYLLRLVELALPDHPEADRYTIYRVYRQVVARTMTAPTPRELKLYVNQIGAVHRQWGHVFPIGRVAYFVALARMGKDVPGELVRGTIPTPQMSAILGPNLTGDLAGLAFNVDRERGQELLLTKPIQEALTANDSAALSTLEQLHGAGLHAVLGDVVASGSLEDDPRSITNAALCLVDSRVLDKAREVEREAIIRTVAQSARDVENWQPLDEAMGKGVAALCRLVGDAEVARGVLQGFRDSVEAAVDEAQAKEFGQEEIAGLVVLCRELVAQGQIKLLGSPFTLPTDADGWIGVCVVLAENDIGMAAYFKPDASIDDVAAVVGKVVTEGKFSAETLAAIRTTDTSPLTGDWTPLAKTLEQRLQAGQNVNPPEVNLLLSALWLLELCDCSAAREAGKRLAEGGHFLHWFQVASTQKQEEARVRCLVAFLRHQPGGAKPQVVGDSAAGHQAFTSLLETPPGNLPQQIVDLLRGQENLPLLLRVVDAREQYDPFIVSCLRHVLASEAPETLFTVEEVTDRWEDLEACLDDEEGKALLQDLIRRLCQQEGFLERVREARGGFHPDMAGLYLAICTASGSGRFRDWCAEGLRGLDGDAWEQELERRGAAFSLLLNLAQAGTSLRMAQALQDALVKHARGVLAGDTEVGSMDRTIWPQLLDTLEASPTRQALRNRLLDEALARDGKCGDVFFDLYGDELKDEATLTGDRGVVRRLFTALVREGNVGGLKWLRALLASRPDFLEQCGNPGDVADFQARLGRAGPVTDTQDGDEADAILSNIAQSLGIEITRRNPESERDVADSADAQV